MTKLAPYECLGTSNVSSYYACVITTWLGARRLARGREEKNQNNAHVVVYVFTFLCACVPASHASSTTITETFIIISSDVLCVILCDAIRQRPSDDLLEWISGRYSCPVRIVSYCK
jgi:hypothetical protein